MTGGASRSGTAFWSVRQLADGLELGAHLELSGGMPGDERVARQGIADVFASLDWENASNDTKILEHASIGKPITDMDQEGRAS